MTIPLGDLGKDPALEIDRRKEVRMGQQHLRLPEQEISPLRQSEVEAIEDLRLRLDVEIHQRVAADQQVDARYRSVVRQVVPAEDDRVAQLLVEDEPPPRFLEIFLEHIGRDACHLLFAVAGKPCMAQRLIVDIGGVDLHAGAELLQALIGSTMSLLATIWGRISPAMYSHT